MLKTFLIHEKYKVIATAIVAALFLYFWIQGPLEHTLEVLNLEQEVTEFSIPKMVGQIDEEEHEAFGTVEDAETHGFGHGLILEREQEKEEFGLLGSAEESPALSPEHGKKVLAHARELSGNKAFELASAPEMYYGELSKDAAEPLQYFESNGVVEGIRGYAGQVNVGVFVDEDGRIVSVHHVSSKETESYLQKIQRTGFYEQFGKMKLEGEHQIDAVSGATLTTEAVAETVSSLMDHATPEPLVNFAAIDEIEAFTVEAKLTWWWIVHIVVIGLMFLYGYQKRIKKSKRAIIVLSILSALYIGFFLNNSFTYVSFIHPFVGTSVSSLVGLYALFTLLGAIWGKNTYCKYVCPFGNVQRLLIQVTPKSARSKFFISNKWVKRIRGAITLVLIVGVLVGLRSWSNFELFPDLFGLDFLSFWFIVAVASVLIAIRYPMIWCRMLCPTGSVLDFISDAVNYKRR